MRTRDVTDYKRRLDGLFKKHDSIPFDELEIRAHWARYLCVLISGFIEVSVKAIYIDYSRRKASPQVSNYVDARLNKLTNVSMNKLLNLTRDFSPQWEEALRSVTEGELAAAVDSIVALRNQIAHGNNAAVSYSNIKDYYKRILQVIELLERQCA